MSATTKKLDYADVPPRASSSRAIRTEVVPSNGNTFNMSNTIIFDLPSNVQNTFWDAQSSYVRLAFKNGNGAPLNFESGGFPSCIRRVEMLLGGQTLCSIDNYNVLYQMMFDLDASQDFRDNAGKKLFGAASGFEGEAVANGATVSVAFPLALTPIVQAQRYFPLIGREPLRIRMEIDSALNSLNGGAADTEITISEVALVMYQLELGQSVMDQVVANSGGMFKMIMPSYQHAQTTLAATSASVAATLGFSMSSLNRVLVAARRQAATQANNFIGNRAQLGLVEANLTIGGVKYPQISIKDRTNNSAEVLAEALVSQRALLSYGHDSSINTGGLFSLTSGDGSEAAQTGKFLLDIDLESQFSPEGSLVAGINCVGQVVQYNATYTADGTNAHVIDIYGEHSIMCALDLQSLTWSIAV